MTIDNLRNPIQSPPTPMPVRLGQRQPIADDILSALALTLAEQRNKDQDEGRELGPPCFTFTRSQLIHGRSLAGAALIDDDGHLHVRLES